MAPPVLWKQIFFCYCLISVAIVHSRKPQRTVSNPKYFDFSKDEKPVHLAQKDFVRAKKRIVPDQKFDPRKLLKNNLVEGDIDGFTHQEFKNFIHQVNELWKLRKSGKIQSSAVNDPLKRWPNGTIPYYLSNRYAIDARTKIAGTLALFHEKTCVKFVPRYNEPDYIYIQPKRDYICSSLIGKNGGEQLLSLGKGCFGLATIFHELMHVLGFYHEQSRNDRDEWIRIIWSNISPNDTINFSKYPLYMIDHLRTTYDYGSVMHYGAKYFSINGQDTIIPLRPLPYGVTLGQTVGPSATDLERINRLYQCSRPKPPPTRPPRTTTTTPRPPRTPPPWPVYTPAPPTRPPTTLDPWIWGILFPKGEPGSGSGSHSSCAPCHGCVGCKGCPGCPDCPDCPSCPPCLPVNNACPKCPECPQCDHCPHFGCQKCKVCPPCPCDDLGTFGLGHTGELVIDPLIGFNKDRKNDKK